MGRRLFYYAIQKLPVPKLNLPAFVLLNPQWAHYASLRFREGHQLLNKKCFDPIYPSATSERI